MSPKLTTLLDKLPEFRPTSSALQVVASFGSCQNLQARHLGRDSNAGMEPTFETDYKHITQRLHAIIREQAGVLIHSHIEQIRGLAEASRHHGDRASLLAKRALLENIDEPTVYRIAHAFSLYFQLVNVCEERERMRRLAKSEEPSMSLRWLFRQLKASKVTPARLQ